MENLKTAYIELAKSDKAKENSAAKRDGALAAFHAVFIGNDPSDVWDAFASVNDFKREVPLMADGKPVIGKNGKPRVIRVGTVDPTSSARTAVSTMRKVYETDGNVSSDWTECRKRYNNIRAAETADEAIVAKHVKSFMKLPIRLRIAVQRAQKDAMLQEANTEQNSDGAANSANIADASDRATRVNNAA